MKKFGSKQIVPLICAAFAILFAAVGFLQLGFWDPLDGPKPGFFPFIIAVVMLLASIAAFFMSFKDTKPVKYERDELIVIVGALGIILISCVIGLLPACYLFIVLWLRFFEKSSWKDTLIVLAVCMAISIGVFRLWLGVYFPMGLFEYIL